MSDLVEVKTILIDALTGERTEAITLEPYDAHGLHDLKGGLLAYLANLRWRKETGGITVGGMFVATDDRSKLLLQGARTAADADPDHVEGWKAPNGDWVDLDASTIIALSNAVRAHVSACFALERDVSAQIEAGTITTREQVEAAFAVEPQA